MRSDLKLANTQLDILMPQPGRDRVEPAAIGEVKERYAARGEVSNGRFGDIDITEEANL